MTEREVGGGPPKPLAAAEIPHLRRALLTFFDQERRDLPWRDTDDAYAIWVSEVMAQQTRVDTVVPYYRAWLEAFPSVDALAEADEAAVLKRWEGLGYYSRARNLHRAARLVRERFGGRIPDTVQRLRELPGVGPYTAGAVASIAFGVATPAVDGNVRRVFARLFDDPAPTAARLAAWGEALVDPERPGDFNQALMELGSTVCTPRSPTCLLCPVAEHCRALAAGTVAERPTPKKRRPVPHHDHVVLVAARRQGEGREGGAASPAPGPGEWRVRLEQRPDEGLLAGMWAFPGEEVAQSQTAGGEGGGRAGAPGARDVSEAHRRAVLELLHQRELAPEGEGSVLELEPVRHAFSHLKVTYRPYLVHVREGASEPGGARAEAPSAGAEGSAGGARTAPPPVAWIPPHDPAALALPVAQQKILTRAAAALASAVARRRPPPED